MFLSLILLLLLYVLIVLSDRVPVELMLLGLISLSLAQCARWISEICVDSSLFGSDRFYLCTERDYGVHENVVFKSSFSSNNETQISPQGLNTHSSHQCGEVNHFQSSNFQRIYKRFAVTNFNSVVLRVVNHLFLMRDLNSYIDSCLFLG